MARSDLVHWHEGLFLQPHHLQLFQRQLLDQFAAERGLALPYPYGVIEYRLSSDALENMLVQFDVLRLVMPGGLAVNVPENAELRALDIKAVFESAAEPFTISLGVPLWYASRANTIERGAGGDSRAKRLYRVHDIEWTDENTGENSQPVLVRHVNARLMFESDDDTDMEVLPLLRIGRATGEEVGAPRQDSGMIPPCLVLGGSPVLRDLIRDLAHQVEASRAELVRQINRGGAFSFKRIRGTQVEQVLRLTILNRFAGRLRQLVQAPMTAPFTVYLELRDLLGGLAALYPETDQFAAADYNHDEPAVCFLELCAKIRRLLRGAVVTPVLRVPFRLEGDILVASLTDDHLTKPTEYYLGIKTSQEARPLVQLVENPDEFKLMPRGMADSAVFGVRLKEERYPPFGLPTEADLHYFRLLRAESARRWDRVKREKALAIRFPGVETSDFTVVLYMTLPEEEVKQDDGS